jgi:tetratricopeptide (TPR) repeat protein
MLIPIILVLALASFAQVPADSNAEQLARDITTAFQNHDYNSAKRLLKQFVAADPENLQAWGALAELQMRDGEIDEAIASATKQLEVNPSSKQACYTLAFALSSKRQFDDAAQVLKKQLALSPNDAKTEFMLAGALSNAGHRDEAMKHFEAAAKADPSNLQVNYALALAYVQSGKVDAAIAAMNRLPDGQLRPYVLDNMAYQLATRNVRLDKALQYAQDAEAATIAQLNSVQLPQVTHKDLDNVNILASEWRTLGLIALRRGKLDDAQQYVEAAWSLQPYAQYGRILETVYERQGNAAKAAEIKALSQAAPRLPETNEETAQFGTERPSPYAGPLSDSDRQHFEAMRTIKLDKTLKETVSAEFWFMVSKTGAEQIAFISGAEQLRSWTDMLKSVDYRMKFPSEARVNVIRRGTVSCYAPTSECIMVLMQPRDFLHAE